MTRASVLLVCVTIASAAACDRLLQFATVAPAPPDAAPDAPPPPPPDLCASDNFDGSAIDTTLWGPYSDPGATVAESGGQLVVTLSSGSGHSYAGAGLLSRSMVGLTTTIEIVRVPTATTGTTTELEWTAGTGNSYILFRDGNTLGVARYVSGAKTYPAATSFDSGGDRYWRIRHDDSANVVYFEAGSDGSSWSPVYSEATAFPLTSAHPVLNCGRYTTVTSPGDCAFDNFTLTGCR